MGRKLLEIVNILNSSHWVSLTLLTILYFIRKETETKLVCYLRYVADNKVGWPTSKNSCKYGNTSCVPVQTESLWGGENN